MVSESMPPTWTRGSRHFGLQGMRERAVRIEGKLTLTSSQSSGTAITWSFPEALPSRRHARRRSRECASSSRGLAAAGVRSDLQKNPGSLP